MTRFSGNQYIVNADLIEFIEETPDTVISLTTGRKVIVKENIDEILEKIIVFKRRIHNLPPSSSQGAPANAKTSRRKEQKKENGEDEAK